MTSEGSTAADAVVQTGPSTVSVPPPLPLAVQARSPLAEFCIDVLIAIAVAFAMSILAGLAWGVYLGLQMALKGSLDPDALAAQAGQPALGFLIVATALSLGSAAAVLLLWRRRPTIEERAQSRMAVRRPATWALAIGTGAGTALLAVGLSSLAEATGLDITPTNESAIRALGAQSPWLLVLFAAGLAPLYEETLFRRVLYGRLLAAGRPLLGLALSAGLFAFVHEVPGSGSTPWSGSLALWLLYAGLGAVFALLYRRSGTLWAPIAAHATHNLIACAALLYDIG